VGQTLAFYPRGNFNLPYYQAPQIAKLTEDKLRHYRYTPLVSENSIRILDLLPGHGDMPLRCKLFETTTSTRFKVLSYVWGDPTCVETLTEVESNAIVSVTLNLHHALRTLRHRDAPLQLWVDALCINQSDIAEKNHQVSSMARIHSQADNVLVWLGREIFEDTMRTFHMLAIYALNLDERALGNVDDIDEFRYLHFNRINDDYKIDADYDLRTRRSLVDTALIRSCNVVTLRGFFGQAWFQRVWVFQEFVLANNVRIFAGPHSITYAYFEIAVYALQESPHLLSRNPVESNQQLWHQCINSINHVAKMLRFRSLYHHTKEEHGEAPLQASVARGLRAASNNVFRRNHTKLLNVRKPSLYQCCRMLNRRFCSDNRDRIYAALGLARDDLAIIPNYNHSATDIFLEMSRKVLLTGELALLHHAGTANTDDLGTQPSFLPCLNDSPPFEHERALGGDITSCYSAGHSRQSLPVLFGARSISVPGVSVDHIVYADLFADVLEDLMRGNGSPHKTQLSDAYNRVKSTRASFTKGEDYGSSTFRQAFWRTLHLGFPLTATDTDFGFLDYSHRTNIWLSFRRHIFYMTSKGYIGLGSSRFRKGDQAVIFDRGETPFVLRKVSLVDDISFWNLIGDCYVEGGMDGSYFGHKVLDNHGKNREESRKEVEGVLFSEDFVLC
jgi:hypothetical protein